VFFMGNSSSRKGSVVPHRGFKAWQGIGIGVLHRGKSSGKGTGVPEGIEAVGRGEGSFIGDKGKWEGKKGFSWGIKAVGRGEGSLTRD
jgi:hypothetical protein